MVGPGSQPTWRYAVISLVEFFWAPAGPTEGAPRPRAVVTLRPQCYPKKYDRFCERWDKKESLTTFSTYLCCCSYECASQCARASFHKICGFDLESLKSDAWSSGQMIVESSIQDSRIGHRQARRDGSTLSVNGRRKKHGRCAPEKLCTLSLFFKED